MRTILVVENQINLLELMSESLSREGYLVLKAKTGVDALHFLENERVALVLLNSVLPDMNGIELLKQIRKDSKLCKLSVILLSDRADEESKVFGLDNGADDYIVKPFSMQELNARIKSVCRRREGAYEVKQEEAEEAITLDYIMINRARRTVTIHGKLVKLSYLEFELLYLFAKNRGIVLTRDKIREEVWGKEHPTEVRSIDVHVSKLRSKIENNQEKSVYIKTVIGMGYKLI